MKVLHISSKDCGGAGNAAYRLHKALLAQGVDSKMLVLSSSRSDPTVVTLGLVYWPQAFITFCMRLFFLIKRYLLNLSLKKQDSMFSDCISAYRLHRHPLVQEADVVNLHWVSWMVDWPSFLLGCEQKIVCTLHDLSFVTASCHYPLECKNYKYACEDCCQMKTVLAKRFIEKLYLRKRRVWNLAFSKNICFVLPSTWLMETFKDNPFLSGMCVRKIPNSVDNDSLSMSDKNNAKHELNLPENKNIVLFVAEDLRNIYKGTQYLKPICEHIVNDDLLVVVVGKDYVQDTAGVIYLGYVSNKEKLNLVYNAADIFMSLSIQDNLPNTVLESMLCGTPTVAFDAGGIRDMVVGNSTGELVKSGDIEAFAFSIKSLLADRARLQLYSINAHKRVEKLFNSRLQAMKYIDTYKELVKGK